MATIQDIAERANVSKSTVSRVMNNSSVVDISKRRAVIEAMDALKFQPNMVARSLAGGKSLTVGILTQNIGSPFYDSVAQGVIEGLAGTDFSPIFVDGQWQQTTESEVIRTLLGRRVDGLILIGGDVATNELDDLRLQLPTIVVAREMPGWEHQCIFIDNEAAGYEATKHLIDFGHRNIALLHGVETQPDAIQRYEGYARALTEAGIGVNPELVYKGDFSGQSGVMAVNSLLARGVHFSAIFAANDMVAFGARLALHRQGIRVPNDVSIVGFDDQAEAAFMTPPLTTMKQPAVTMGRASVKALLELIDNKKPDLPKLSAELQKRESVARLC